VSLPHGLAAHDTTYFVCLWSLNRTRRELHELSLLVNTDALELGEEKSATQSSICDPQHTIILECRYRFSYRPLNPNVAGPLLLNIAV
jgi:hypothetical protein